MARRRGSVVKRPEGWSALISLGRDSETRKRRRLWLEGHFDTQREAKEKLTEALGQAYMGTLSVDHRKPLGAYLGEG